jgi:RNA polymerase sigma-70 factor (ECF subfamily)
MAGGDLTVTGADGVGEWWQDHREALWRYALVLAGRDSDLTEELLDFAMVTLVERWETISSCDAPVAYLKKAMARRLIRVRRQRWRLLQRILAKRHPAASTDAVDVAMIATVRQAITRLTPLQRAVIVMHYYDGLPFSEIGRALHRTDHAVEQVHRRARERLKASLAGDIDLLTVWPPSGAGERGTA